MEQIKMALGWLKRHHFWVLSLIVLGVAVGAWYSASSTLSSEFEANSKKIDSEFKSQTSLRGKPFKPNDDINGDQRREIQQLATRVEQIWRGLYGSQEESVLIWPKELGEKFARHMEGKTFGDTIRGEHRDRYLNYIQKRFIGLLAIVDAEDLGESAGGRRGGGIGLRGGRGGALGGEMGLGGRRPGARGGDAALEPEETHLVDWQDQDILRSRMDLAKRPKSLEIWVLQEDLWVYQTLLKQIADTNKASGATRRNRAPIRTIFEMQVGQAAAGANDSTGRLFIPQDTGPQLGGGFGGGFGDEMGMGRGMMDRGMGGEMGMGRGMMDRGMGMGMGRGGPGFEAGEGDTDSILLAGRYIDDTGQPITTVPTGYKFGTEFKRLPLRMTLEMDYRWTPRLIVELATAPLQVEVEQVRFNPGDVSTGGGRSRSSSSGGGRGVGGDVQAFDRAPSVGTVVLHGAVYIFNEPDEQILSVDDGDAI